MQLIPCCSGVAMLNSIANVRFLPQATLTTAYAEIDEPEIEKWIN